MNEVNQEKLASKEQADLSHLAEDGTCQVEDMINGITKYSAQGAIELVETWKEEGLEVVGLSLENPVKVVDRILPGVGNAVRGEWQHSNPSNVIGLNVDRDKMNVPKALEAMAEEIDEKIKEESEREKSGMDPMLLKTRVAFQIAIDNLQTLRRISPHLDEILKEEKLARYLSAELAFESLGKAPFYKVLPA